MSTERRFGQPGKQPIWEWDWPWRRFFRQLGGWRPQGTEAVSGRVTPSKWMPKIAPTTPVRQLSPETTKWLGNLSPEQRQLWLAQWAQKAKEQLAIKTAGTQGARISDIPMARQAQGGTLQNLFNQLSELRAQTGLPTYLFDANAPMITDYAWTVDDMLLRAEQGKTPTSEFDEDAYYRDSLKWYENQIEQVGQLQERITGAGQAQMADVSGSEMAERLRQQDRWRANQRLLLAGLPSGPEGDVARWFVSNTPDPWARLGRVGTEPSASEMGPKPLGPPAPSWLPEFVPGTAAGEPIGGYTQYWPAGASSPVFKQGSGTMPFIPTPSGQQYTRMTPSQERWMTGAIGHYGGRSWEDIINEMKSMLPLTPAGAGQKRWRPPSQRIAV